MGGSCAGGICCVDTPAPDGTDCSAEPGGGDCSAGICLPLDCTSDLQCDDGNDCTFDSCNLGTGICSNVGAPVNGTACLLPGCPNPVSEVGTCFAGACTPNNSCSTDGVCPNTPAPPADSQCTVAVCVHPPSCGSFCDIDLAPNQGGACDFSGPGAADGVCQSDGTCGEAPCQPTTVSGTTVTACRNSFNQAVSTFTVDMTATPNACITAGSPFTVDITPTLTADLDFLNLAASTLCNLGFTLTEADLSLVQVQIDAVAGASCSAQLSELSPVPQTVTLDATVTGICGSGGTVVVHSPISVPLPQVTLSCLAGSAPGPAAFCATGLLPFTVTLADSPVDTWLSLQAGPIGVNFGCGEAKVTPSTPCSSNADCVPGSACLLDGTCENIVVALDPLTDCLLLSIEP